MSISRIIKNQQTAENAIKAGKLDPREAFFQAHSDRADSIKLYATLYASNDPQVHPRRKVV